MCKCTVTRWLSSTIARIKRHFAERKIIYIWFGVIPATFAIFIRWMVPAGASLGMKPNDVIQDLGQFATVGAFWIAFQHLRKSKEDVAETIRRERQKYFFDESQACLSEMLGTVREFKPENV